MTENKDPKAQGAPMGGASSYSSKMMRSMIESVPTAETQLDLSELPEVPMPSLEGLEVYVEALPAPTEDDVTARLEQIYFQCTPRKVRKAGEKVQLGDEVLLDLVGFVEGKIVPFSARQDLSFQLEADTMMPGFGQALAGTLVGDSTTVTVNLGDDFEVEALRGRKMAFAVHVKGAAEIEFAEPDTPEMLQRMGYGENIDATRQALAAQMTEERSQLMVSEGFHLVLEELTNRIETAPPKQFVDEEIRTQWKNGEGAFLLEKGITRKDMDDALQAWLDDEDLRETAEFRMKVAMLVRAYIKTEPLDVNAEEVKAFVRQFGTNMGIDPESWLEALKKDKAEQADLLDNYVYMRTVAHIMAEAKVHYGGEAG